MTGHRVAAHAHKLAEVDNKSTSGKIYINAVKPRAEVDQKGCTQKS